VTIEGMDDVVGLQKIGRIVALCLEHMKKSAEIGMTTLELDAIGQKFLEANGARSAPILTYGFPGHTCISVNSVVAHGIPSSKVILRNGDLVNVDVSAELEGYFGDTGGSFGIGDFSEKKYKLCEAGLRARDEAISVISEGVPFSAVARAVTKVARSGGYGILEDLMSHGVGRALHEEPKYIASHVLSSEKRVFKKGKVITIEPFLTTGPRSVTQEKDGWSLTIPKGQYATQFEHTLIVTDGKPILTTLLE
jgi:methionyl aminopeptidase